MTPDADNRPTSRRSFFGLAGSAALLCTIGGEKVVVDSPAALRKADATAARVRRPQAAAAQAVPQLQPAPGGVRREYWIQAQTQRWRIVPTKRDDWHNRAIPGQDDLPRLHLRRDDVRLRGAQARSEHSRADAVRGGRRRARRPLPQRRPSAAPGGDHAPARRQVQPRVRRRLHGRVHPRGRLRRAGRELHLPVGVHSGVGRLVAVPRPRAEPHAQHVPRACSG